MSANFRKSNSVIPTTYFSLLKLYMELAGSELRSSASNMGDELEIETKVYTDKKRL